MRTTATPASELTMSLRPLVFWAHLVVGVAAGLVVLSMAASGMLLAYEPQLEAWADGDLRVSPVAEPDAKLQGVDALLAAAQAAHPEARPSAITLRSDPSATAFVALGREDGVYVDVYTARILGRPSGARRLLHRVEEWHRWLGARDRGQAITGAACAAFFLLLVSGLYLWLKARVLAFRRGLTGRASDFNRHSVVGFWIAPLVLVTTATGLVLSYSWASDLLFRMAGSAPPARGAARERAASGGGASDATAAFDPLWAVAQRRVPGWRSITVRLPASTTAPVAFSIDAGDAAWPRRSQLWLDAGTGDVRKWEPYETQTRGARLRALVTPLHTGRIAGPTGQTLTLLSAAGVSVLVWSGLSMAWRRFRAQRGPGSEDPNPRRRS